MRDTPVAQQQIEVRGVERTLARLVDDDLTLDRCDLGHDLPAGLAPREDPAGYDFGVATDTACRNRLLHSRPIEGSEHLPRLWRAGIRGYQVVFNVEAEPIADVVAAYRQMLDRLAAGQELPANETGELRAVLHGEFTRGHFARAV